MGAAGQPHVRIGQWAQQVNPMYRPNPDRPLPHLDKQADVVAAVRAYGSDEVVEAFEAWQKVIADMLAAAQLIAREPDAAEPRHILTVWKVGYKFQR